MVGVPITITTQPRFYRWVAVVTLTLGLVAMHHLVGTHAHSSGSQHSSAGMMMPASPVEKCCGTTHVAAAPAQPDPEDGLMLHLCLAILTGLVLLAALGQLWHLARAPEPGPPDGGPGEPASRQRAPPTPLRLAHLGVLRL
jgi:hypothetical protein